MKIITILGARPQFIKAATVSRAFKSYTSIEEKILHTGQHFDSNMSDVFFDQMDLPQPAFNLGIASLSHGAMMGRMLEGIEHILMSERPDQVLVYGDTNSTLAGALAACKLHVPVIHIEAGLRSHNLAMPEEVNRVLTDRISSTLFCPSVVAVSNLQSEGFPHTNTKSQDQIVINVGDVMYDAILHYQEKAKSIISLDNLGIKEKEYALCTLHRAENTDDPKKLEAIFQALQKINETLDIVMPIHPRTYSLIKRLGRQDWLSGLRILEPLPYLEMQRLEMGAQLILTDSGGIQKESYFHNVPCITLRDETEWIETVELGWNVLTGANFEKIIAAFNCRVTPNSNVKSVYGNGDAAKIIANYIWGNL